MASLTLTFTQEDADRILDALTERHNLSAPTVDDVKAFLITDLQDFVRKSEKRIAVRDALPMILADRDLTAAEEAEERVALRNAIPNTPDIDIT